MMENISLEHTIIKLGSNFPFIFIVLSVVYACYTIYTKSKEHFEEKNVFDIDRMSVEERKLLLYTRELTNINKTRPEDTVTLANRSKYFLYSF